MFNIRSVLKCVLSLGAFFFAFGSSSAAVACTFAMIDIHPAVSMKSGCPEQHKTHRDGANACGPTCAVLVPDSPSSKTVAIAAAPLTARPVSALLALPFKPDYPPPRKPAAS